MQPNPTSMSEGGTSRALAIAFATTTAMWLLSYVAMLQPGSLAGEVIFGVTILVLCAGSALAAIVDVECHSISRAVRRGADGRFLAGAVAAGVVGATDGRAAGGVAVRAIEPAAGGGPLLAVLGEALLVLAHEALDVHHRELLEHVQRLLGPRARHVAGVREGHVTDRLPRPRWAAALLAGLQGGGGGDGGEQQRCRRCHSCCRSLFSCFSFSRCARASPASRDASDWQLSSEDLTCSWPAKRCAFSICPRCRNRSRCARSSARRRSDSSRTAEALS